MVQWPWPPGTIIVRVGYPAHAIPEGTYCTVLKAETLWCGNKNVMLVEHPNLPGATGWWMEAFRPAESDHCETTTIKETVHA